jgi:hypothetical protein
MSQKLSRISAFATLCLRGIRCRHHARHAALEAGGGDVDSSAVLVGIRGVDGEGRGVGCWYGSACGPTKQLQADGRLKSLAWVRTE